MRQQRIYIDTSIVGGFFDEDNAVNLKNGYPTIEIRNPRELIDYEKDI